MIELILNPHSIKNNLTSLSEADDAIFEFINCFIEIGEKLNLQTALRSSKQITEFELTNTQTIFDWIYNDLSTKREERLYLLQISQKYPLLLNINVNTVNDFFIYECFINNMQSPEYSLAYLNDLLMISFSSEEIWKKHLLDLNVTKIGELDLAGTTEIKEYKSILKNFSSITHLDSHEEWFKEILRAKASNRTNFWNFKDALFPNLIFTETVKSNMLEIQEIQYEQVIHKLIDLELLTKKWNMGDFPFNSISGSWSPESTTTLQKFKLEHTFKIPTGEDLLFNFHLKCTVNAWRIYFYPNIDNHKVIIGYIGKHLPTAKNP